MDITNQFDAYRITNGQWRKKAADTLATATALGCVGAVNGTAETRAVSKRCEGDVVKERTIIQKLNMTFRGHMPVGVIRDVFGLSNKDLKEGVHGYGKHSAGSSGSLTFDVYDMDESVIKKVAFPNITWTGGLSINLENGLDEIAEVEVAFSAYFDENGYCYYETFDDAISGWNKEFTSELVAQPAP